jgi:signal transduction histidine kinase
MDALQILKNTINAIDKPVMVVDNHYRVIAINTHAYRLLDIDADKVVPSPCGVVIDCFNSANYGECSTTPFCLLCKLKNTIDLLCLNPQESIQQEGLIVTQKKLNKAESIINFSASYLNFNDGAVVFTFNQITPGRIHLHENGNVYDSCEQPLPESVSDDQGSVNRKQAVFQLPSIRCDLSEACINALFDHCTHGIILIDDRGEIIKVNQLLLDWTQCNIETIKKKDSNGNLIGFHPDDKVDDTSGSWQLLKSVANNNLKFDGYLRRDNQPSLNVTIEIIPVYNLSNTRTASIIMVSDRSGEQELFNQFEINYHALEHSPNECYFIRQSGAIVYANQFARSAYNWNDTMSEAHYISQVNTNGIGAWWHQQWNDLEKNGIVQFESEHISKNGNRYPVSVLMYFVKDIDFELVCYFATDISEKKKSEEKIITESKINSSLSEIARELSFYDKFDAVALLVRQYAMEITNSNFCFLRFYDPGTRNWVSSIYNDSSDDFTQQVDIVGSYLYDFYHSAFSDSKTKRQVARKILNDPSEFIMAQQPIGLILPFPRMAWTGVFFHDDFQGILFIAGKEDDYTDDDINNLENLSNLFGLAINRIQEKEKLIETNNRLSLAIEVANMGMWEVFPEEQKVKISAQLNKMMKGNSQELILDLHDMFKLIHPDDLPNAIEAYEKHEREHSQFYQHNSRMAYPGNPYRWYQTIARIIKRSDKGNPIRILGVQLDITNQIEMTEQLIQSRMDAIAANRAKSDFLARISHELRTPLNAIIGFADLLYTNITAPAQREYLSAIRKSSVTLVELITDVLDFSKIEAGKLTLQISDVVLVNLLNEIKQLFHASIVNKQLDFKLIVDSSIPTTVQLDELRIKQILINLIGNAIKFTKQGFVELKVAATETIQNKVDLTFVVTDTGIGIKAESQKIIFNDFTQQDDQDNRQYGGTGLGLGIVKKLIELMGGTISLESEQGKGSCFTVILPAVECSDVIVKTPDLTTQFASTETISTKSPTLCDEYLAIFSTEIASDWNEFIKMPSFKAIPAISKQFRKSATTHQIPVFMDIADKLDQSIESFNVNELQCIIKEVEQITGNTKI